MYYGSYSNETLVGLVEYNMQLAYFFTIAVYMVLCGIALILRSVKSFIFLMEFPAATFILLWFIVV